MCDENDKPRKRGRKKSGVPTKKDNIKEERKCRKVIVQNGNQLVLNELLHIKSTHGEDAMKKEMLKRLAQNMCPCCARTHQYKKSNLKRHLTSKTPCCEDEYVHKISNDLVRDMVNYEETDDDDDIPTENLPVLPPRRAITGVDTGILQELQMCRMLLAQCKCIIPEDLMKLMEENDSKNTELAKFNISNCIMQQQKPTKRRICPQMVTAPLIPMTAFVDKRKREEEEKSSNLKDYLHIRGQCKMMYEFISNESDADVMAGTTN